jgi:hypothetical protein
MQRVIDGLILSIFSSVLAVAVNCLKQTAWLRR